MGQFAFRFISGKYQGTEFPVADEGELIIGRAADLELVLFEDMVSRKHAKVTAAGGNLTITDLGSTNGTFVNGEKVRRRDLVAQDRILIGTSILKLVPTTEVQPEHRGLSADEVRAQMLELGDRVQRPSTMSGELHDVPLPDLLQLFGTNRKSGVLTITGAHRGKLYLKQGQLECAIIDEQTWMLPMKALCRMLVWDSGSFRLDDYVEGVTFAARFGESTEGALIEASRHNDEVGRIRRNLPAPETKLQLCVPLTPKLAALSADELETLQTALNHGSVQEVFDNASATDHAIAAWLQKLLKDGYLETV